MLLAVILLFEGKDGEYTVDIAPYLTYPVRFPRPYFGRNIIDDGTQCGVLGELRHAEVKAGIVDEDDAVGFPFRHGPFALPHAPQDGTGMQEHLYETHICQGGIVPEQCTPMSGSGSHKVASEEPEACVPVALPQSGNQMRCVKVARCLSADDKVFHSLSEYYRHISASSRHACSRPYAVLSRVCGVMAT